MPPSYAVCGTDIAYGAADPMQEARRQGSMPPIVLRMPPIVLRRPCYRSTHTLLSSYAYPLWSYACPTRARRCPVLAYHMPGSNAFAPRCAVLT
eukprot:3461334-Rhodomonas_salina.3